MSGHLRRHDLGWLAAAVGLVCAAYGRLVAAGFTNWDDDRFVTANPLLRAGLWTYTKAAFGRPQFEAYAPLHLMSYRVDAALWPASAGGYHALSLALLLVGLAVWFTLARRYAPAPAAAAAVAVFALHPLTVEPVAWIAARKDLLALIFVGLTLLATDRQAGARPRPVALALGAAAFLSKVSTVCLPVLVVAQLRWLRGWSWRASLLGGLPYAVGAAALALATWLIFHDNHMIPSSRPVAAVVDVLGTVAAYVGRAWAPSPSAIYPAAAPHAWLGAALVAGAVVATAATWSRWPGAARYAAVAYLAALAPVANLVPVVFRFADRYALLAHAALVPAAAIGLGAAWRWAAGRARRRWAVVVGIVALVVCELVVTLPTVAAWHDSRSLWRRAVRQQPAAVLAYAKLGETLRDEHAFAEAHAAYQHLIERAPGDPRGYIGLFLSDARRCEVEGGLPAGTAAAWYASLERATEDPARFRELYGVVAQAGCGAGATAMVRFGLLRWPRPVDKLARWAADARRAGDVATAEAYEEAIRRAAPR